MILLKIIIIKQSERERGRETRKVTWSNKILGALVVLFLYSPHTYNAKISIFIIENIKLMYSLCICIMPNSHLHS